jgi:hypothetical protein
MFSLFKKSRIPKNIGAFRSYGMEDFYWFLGENRIDEKKKSLLDKATLGTPFEKFISDETFVVFPSGELKFFSMVLNYFSKEFDVAHYAFQKSFDFNVKDYPKNEYLKGIWVQHLKSMDQMEKKDPYYNYEKRSKFWLEFDLLYQDLLRDFIYAYNIKSLNQINFEGEFSRRGSHIFNQDFEVLFRVKNLSKKEYYLTLKGGKVKSPVKINLIEVEKDFFHFRIPQGNFSMKVYEDYVEIELLKKIENKNNDLISETDFDGLFSKLAKTYLENFEQISARYLNDVRRYDISIVFGLLLVSDFISENLKIEIKEKIVAVDNNLSVYENINIDNFSAILYKIEF